jgi:NSS family neurotransmitter:Na+ symporter
MTNKIFADFSSDPLQVFIFFSLIMGLTIFIISKGVKKGIEKWTKILMPALFLLIVLLAVRALTLPGAGKGLSFYLNPDFSKLNGTVILFAVGQAFFSLSLGMGTMITYGSYISKSSNLVTSAGWVSFADTFIALLAGLIIFPTLVSFGQPVDVGGEGLAFQIFPLILSQFAGGYIFGILFFTLLTVAALTSTISLLEVPVAYFVDEKNWSRKKAVLVIGILTFILGIPSALSMGGMEFFTKLKFLGFFAFAFGNVSLAVGAFFICVFVGYIWGRKKAFKEIASGNPRFKLRHIWAFSLMILTPIVILIILYFIKTIAG